MDATTIVALAGGAAGLMTAAVALYRANTEKRKTAAETEGTVVDTAVNMAERLTTVAGSLVGPLQAQLQIAQADLTQTRERVASLETKSNQLDASYRDCRRREAEAIKRAEILGGELDALKSFLQIRRVSDLEHPGEDPRPRTELWSEERRQAYRVALQAQKERDAKKENE